MSSMRLQRQKTALENTTPQVLWGLICLPVVLLFMGVIFDYTSMFDVREYILPSEHCKYGCELSYTLYNRFGVIPINYIQVATSITERGSDRHTTEGQSIWGFDDVFRTNDQTTCPDGLLSDVTASVLQSDRPTTSWCADFSYYSAHAIGTLAGLVLDTPSPELDARVQSINAVIHVPPFHSKEHTQLVTQFVVVSPLYADVRTVLQIVLICLTVILLVAFCRAVEKAKETSHYFYIPEQPYCKAMLCFLLIWVNPVAAFRSVVAPVLLLSVGNTPAALGALSYLYILERICGEVGCQGILFCLLCITSGIGGGVKMTSEDGLIENEARGSEQRLYSFRGENSPGSDRRSIAAPEDHYPDHHPDAVGFVHFLGKKALFLLLAVCSVLLKYAIRFPSILGIPYESDQAVSVVDTLYVLLTAGLFACTLVWLYKLYQALAAAIHRFSAEPTHSVYLGADNSPDFSGYGIYTRVAVRLASYQLSLWLCLAVFFSLYWVSAFSSSELLSSPLVRPFYGGGDGDYRANMVFTNRTGFHRLLVNGTESLRDSIISPQTAGLNVKSSVGFIGRATRELWINFCRYVSVDPSVTLLLICTTMCFSVAFAFSPAGVCLRDVMPCSEYLLKTDSGCGSDSVLESSDVYYTTLWNYETPQSPIARGGATVTGYGATDAVDIELGGNQQQLVNSLPIFCLEKACFLLECSWQTYFKPPESTSVDGADTVHEESAHATIGSPDESSELLGVSGTSDVLDVECKAYRDLDQLGLTLVRDVVSVLFQLRSYVATRPEDNVVVVAFRGTYGMNNVKTDLTFNQTPLPNMDLLTSSQRRPGGGRPAQIDVTSLVESIVFEDTPERDTTADSAAVMEDAPIKIGARELIPLTSPEDSAVGPLPTRNDPITFETILQASKNIIRNGYAVVRGTCTRQTTQEVPKVHAGFWAAYAAIRRDMYRGIIQAMMDLIVAKNGDNDIKHNKPLQILFTGHSLGGALATIATLDVSVNIDNVTSCLYSAMRRKGMLSSATNNTTYPVIELYTYGAPRVGNQAFKLLFESMVCNSFRIEVNGDMICRTPMLAGYRHAAVVPVLICDALSTRKVTRPRQRSEWWDIATSSDKGAHLTSLLLKPSYAQFLLIRKHTSSLEYHGLIAYRNYLESKFTDEEKILYAEKYRHAHRSLLQTRSVQAQR